MIGRLRIFLLAAVLLTLVVSVAPANWAAATPSANPNDQQRVIVHFDRAHKGAVVGALRRAGGQIHLEFDDVGAIAVTVPVNALQGLARNPNVVEIEADVLRRPMGETVPYGIDAVQARDVWDADHDGVIDDGAPTGAGITVCVIDSGIYDQHEDFAGLNILGGYPTGWNYDTCGHGTHVAGTIAAVHNNVGVVGVTPGEVSFYSVQVFTGAACDWTYSSNLADAANRCAAADADIISMSLGGAQKSKLEQRTFDNLYAQGILSIAAAGNDGNTAYSYPASYDSVVSVAALDENNEIADFSQQNNQVEVAAPGVAVLSTVPWIATDELTVDGAFYDANHIEFAPTGSVSGDLADGGLCDSSGAWAGKIVLCARGDISFYDKVMNVQNGGGAAAIIYNNEPGNFLGTLGDPESASDIIAISLSQEDGQFLVTNKQGIAGDIFSELIQPADGYEAWDGTSMATPHVSGVAALIWSADPTKTNVEIREALATTALDLGAAGRDNAFGYGLVQAYDAWQYLGGGGPVNVPPVASFSFSCTDLACTFDGSGSTDSDGSIVEYAWDFGDGSSGSGMTTSYTYGASGDYAVTLTVTDDGGATGDTSETVSVTSGGSGDTTPPVISNITTSKIGRSGKFTVKWMTDEPATSVVVVDGLDTFIDTALVTSHSMTMSGSRGVSYQITITSVDAAGNPATVGPFTYQN